MTKKYRLYGACKCFFIYSTVKLPGIIREARRCGFSLTQPQVRKMLHSLEQEGYAVISKGRAGSTITQQLVKNNVLAGGSETSWGARLERKLQEQYLAVKLEQSSQMSKEETKKWILTNYLNSINLGKQHLWGVKTAARRYFDKELGGTEPGGMFRAGGHYLQPFPL